MTVGVCLCGTPLDPLIGGIRGGHTPNAELARFLKSLAAGKQCLKEKHDGSSIPGAAEEQLVRPDALRELETRLQKLQREMGRKMRSGLGGRWELPTRPAASQKSGSLTRDALALKLQEGGLEFRKARQILDLILGSVVRSLKRGEKVSVPPLGTFEVVKGPKMRLRFSLGKVQTLYRQPRKVVFHPSDVLRLRLANWRRWIPPEVKVPEKNQYQLICCPKCGSTDFMEGEFRKYYKVPSSMPGGDLAVASEGSPMRALVCICGEPVPLGPMRRQVRGDRKSFQESMQAALTYREQAEPQRIIDTLAGSFARKQVQENLVERVNKMEAVVQALPKAGATGEKTS